MLRLLSVALATACLLGAAAGQDGDEDRTEKLKPPSAAGKAVKEMDKLDGYHYTEDGRSEGGSGQDQSVSFEGVVKDDFCSATGTMEMYAKKTKVLVRDSSDKFVPRESLTGDEAIQAEFFRTPQEFLAEVKAVKGASWDGEGSIGEADCRILKLTADAKQLEAQIKKFADRMMDRMKDQIKERVPPQFREMIPDDLTQFIDKKNSKSTYRLWIGKADLLVRKLTWDLELKISMPGMPGGGGRGPGGGGGGRGPGGGGGPGGGMGIPDKVSVKYELTFSKFNEDLDVEIPKEVRKKLRIKNKKKKK
ncbi:MAG: hypothetical protein ACYTAF_15890 [Planctomycetota bacterium]|jgi:hypothetical protein